MDTLLQDLRYAIRMLLKSPGFATVAILVLALGIGANTAIFSVINAVLLRPLPFADADRLVTVWGRDLKTGEGRGDISYPDFVDWRVQNHVFETMAAFRTGDVTLTGDNEPARIFGAAVSADLFGLLGVKPLLGRSFASEEDRPSNHVAILSYGIWHRYFGADPNVLGRLIKLNYQNFTIVGVMPKGFQFPIQAEPVELWTTIAIDAESKDGREPITAQRSSFYLRVIARLRSQVTVARAQAEMDTIEKRLERQYPDTNTNAGVSVVPEFENLTGDIRPALLILFTAVGCLLLIACVNVANLLLSRATTRYREMAIRAALGAGRMRILRQLLTESILLSLLGGALGLMLAMWGAELLIRLDPRDIPRATEVSLDGRVLGFTILMAMMTGVIFGLAPALRALKINLTESLKEGRSSASGTRPNYVRGTLVVIEVALALVLMVSAGLLINSLLRLGRVNPGFDPHSVLSLSLGLPHLKYANTQQVRDFYQQLLSHLGALPGVAAASAIAPLPLSGDTMACSFEIYGRSTVRGEYLNTHYRAIGLDYFRAMRIPVMKGRDFTARDDRYAPGVIIINETLARRFFPNENPLGKHIRPAIRIGERGIVMREIVGVVGDVKHRSLSRQSDAEVYVPHTQAPFNNMTLVVRANGDPRGIIAAIRNEIREMDKDLPVYDVRTLDQYLAISIAHPRFNTLLLAIFAGIALVLAAVGLYGVMSYTVTQRMHEIGVRMALGAQMGDVLRLVVGQGMVLVLVGVAIGLVAAFSLTRLMSKLLFGIRPTDPVTFVAVSVLLSSTALLATYIPARRAAKVDPVVALRCE